MYTTAKSATFNTLKECKGELTFEEFASIYHVVRFGIMSVQEFNVKDGLQSDDDIYSEYVEYLTSFENDNHG